MQSEVKGETKKKKKARSRGKVEGRHRRQQAGMLITLN